MNVVHITPEQKPIFDRVIELQKRADSDPRLWNEKLVVEQARALIGEASAAGIPSRAFVILQVMVARYDREAALPEHLRAEWYRP